MTRGHVIPEAIGGTLWCPFECASCNSLQGGTLEANLKKDPAVRCAVEALVDREPALATKLRDGQQYVAEEEGVEVRAVADGGGFRVGPSPQADGTMVHSDNDARKSVETIVRREGGDEAQVRAAIGAFDAAQPGTEVELTPSLSIRKGQVKGEDFSVDFRRTTLAPNACFLAIAYRFLALAVGPAIFCSELNGVRAAMQGQAGADWTVKVLRANRAYEPWHGLTLRPQTRPVTVEIRLFGQLAWQVEFSSIRFSPASAPSATYERDLSTGAENYRA